MQRNYENMTCNQDKNESVERDIEETGALGIGQGCSSSSFEYRGKYEHDKTRMEGVFQKAQVERLRMKTAVSEN